MTKNKLFAFAGAQVPKEGVSGNIKYALYESRLVSP